MSHDPPVSALYAESRSAAVFYVSSLYTISGLKCKYFLCPDLMTVENQGEAKGDVGEA